MIIYKYFNPILVLFKQLSLTGNVTQIGNFNPILVLFKLVNNRVSSNRVKPFQSYISLIQAYNIYPCDECIEPISILY